jgi:hypothetical protein
MISPADREKCVAGASLRWYAVAFFIRFKSFPLPSSLLFAAHPAGTK